MIISGIWNLSDLVDGKTAELFFIIVSIDHSHNFHIGILDDLELSTPYR